ncbi:lactose permease [Protomyces lactucae-debilis]|uniref:Lactose permease n=1 Tax=Protomyces lactucae-debilis TaxID=2754530 RepID=A0A1Y2F5P9_PROLT|nr:lactose permease [Protomyces lactucae-debilis]ORY78255.1 lactose permease [Protomyces lactucae-debilis]
MSNKEAFTHVESLGTQDVAQETIVQGSAELNAAALLEKPMPGSPMMLKLYAICFVAFLCSSINGFDGSLMTSLIGLQPFKSFFGAESVGAKTGLIFGMYQIGGVAALPFVGPACDTFGRRAGMVIGCLIVIIGTVVSGTSHNLQTFLAGRFLLGFGNSISSSAAPAYVVEIAFPTYRGTLTGLYNCCYFLGSILAGLVTFSIAVVDVKTNLAWRLPLFLQLVMPAIVCMFAYFLPESPRWLVSNHKTQEAKEIITKYHGSGNPESVWVRLQMEEIERDISTEGSNKRAWDYRELFAGSNARWRLTCMLIVSLFGQLSGNGLVGYYLVPVLEQSGLKDAKEQLGINLGNQMASAIAAVTGARIVDKAGRRRTLIIVCFLMAGCFACITACTAVFAKDASNGASIASIFFIFVFSIVYSFGLTPLQALYPVETLKFESRAKGMAFSSLAVNAASLMNQFAFPVALKNIQWKVYFVFIAWNCIQGVIAYFFVVETKGRTLEELDVIFSAKNPPRESIRPTKLVVTDEKIVKAESL